MWATRKLTAEEQTALDAAAGHPVDTSGDDAEIRDFGHAIRGALYRPVKRQLTLKLDADVIDWFMTHQIDGRDAPPKGYQTRINLALRLYVQGHDKEFGLPARAKSETPGDDASAPSQAYVHARG